MRRALATLLLALAIVGPLAAQSAAPPGPTTRYTRLYHEGHPSTAVHRIAGKKLFEEIAARAPVAL